MPSIMKDLKLHIALATVLRGYCVEYPFFYATLSPT